MVCLLSAGEPNLTAVVNIPSGGNTPVQSAPSASFEPKDEYNNVLDRNVHPPGYINPTPADEYDLVVIGAVSVE